MAQPDAPLAFGHQALSERLVQDIVNSLERPQAQAMEPSLVVGLFGEWGAGKSRLLRAIEQTLPRGDGERQLNVVVPFNAWRFEREPQLLIPLLRVAQHCLKKALEASLPDEVRHNEALSDRLVLLGELAQTLYEHGGRQLAQAALAAHGIGLKLPEPASMKDTKDAAGKPEASKPTPGPPWRRWRERREALAGARRWESPISTPQSLYYDFLEHLKAVTGRNPSGLAQHRARLHYRGLGWWPKLRHDLRAALGWLGTGELPQPADLQVNLVFLIDDLDRCLPDKAVEVLEAIKLFLEVEGCAFVLALDEEVVERGIAHRYRDYALQGKDSLAPITGAEYLEKLVHLPVRVPRPLGSAAQQFLADERPDWFAESGRPNGFAAFVAAITPPVPRKLKRMVSLLDMAEKLGAGNAETPQRREWLAVVCALQLFAPQLYRYLRTRGAQLLITLSRWRDEARFRDLAALRTQLQEEVQRETSPGLVQDRIAITRLPDLCEATLQNRSGFDLLELLARVAQLDSAARLSATHLGALMAFVEVQPEPSEPVEPTSRPEATPPQPPATWEEAPPLKVVMPPTRLPDDPFQAPDPGVPPAAAQPAAAAEPATEPTPSPAAPVARLENERGLLEALGSGDLELSRLALSREGAALEGKFLPEEFCERLFDGPLGVRLNEWVASDTPPDPTGQLMQELRPHLSQRQALMLISAFGEPMQQALGRPSWAEGAEIADGGLSQFRAPPLLAGREFLLPTMDDWTALQWQAPRGWRCDSVRLPLLGSSNVAVSVSADGEFGVRARLEFGTDEASHVHLRWIEPGSFVMGSSPNELGRHPREGQFRTITLSRGYWICETACTQGLWRRFAAIEEHDWVAKLDDLPIGNVRPDEVELFLAKLEALLPGCDLALPSEAEWECAARAGTRTAWAFGDKFKPERVNAQSERRVPVCSLAPNAWGLYEMHGNVAELCRDYLSDEERAPNNRIDPEGAPGHLTGRYALRGGSKRSKFHQTRSAALARFHRDERRDDVGFRFILRAREAAGVSGLETEPIQPST